MPFLSTVDSKSQARVGDLSRFGGFAMGCQAWTFNRSTVFEAIELIGKSGAAVVEFFPGQRLGGGLEGGLGDNTPGEILDRVRAECEKRGLRIDGFGVAGLGKDDAANRRLFEMAKRLGVKTITSEPDPAGMDSIEAHVKQFDIRVAIHNHPKQPNNPNYKYWDPEYVLSLVKSRDRRIGSCADIGHWVRSGLVPVDCLKKLKGRVLASHMKDLNEVGPRGRDVPFGTGVSDIPAVLTELKKQKFDGHISVEYEISGAGPLEDVASCIGFVRGWSASR
jgi:sugar phosphate isomerase/epimerase